MDLRILTDSMIADPLGDIFATWAVGAAVAVAPRMLFFANLGWAIQRLGVTHLTCTPSLWQSLEHLGIPSSHLSGITNLYHSHFSIFSNTEKHVTFHISPPNQTTK